MKLCKTCKWSSNEGNSVTPDWQCSNERCGSTISVVDGSRTTILCEYARHGGRCGMAGAHWEAAHKNGVLT